jgi:protein-S-isoprenylcysteine O-methyltransferase Ste14
MLQHRPISPLRLAWTVVYVLAWPALLLMSSGDWRWVEGWLFGAWFIAMSLTCLGWLYRNDPELLAERYRMPGTGDQQGWDRLVVAALAVGFVAWIVVMGLDRRFDWTRSWPDLAVTAGVVMLAVSFFLLFRAFTDNTFASPLVRIQTERHQRVVSTGVYGLVRHPMYLGAVLMFLGAPLLLGSVVGLAAGAALSLVLVARIVGEERLLSAQLEGYAAYRRRVRYRLVPLVW